MKLKPILFSTPMVQAILDNRKSMTRRMVKFPKDYTGGEVYPNGSFGLKYESGNEVKRLFPKYQIGDILWVREMFYAYGHWTSIYDSASGKTEWTFKDLTIHNNLQYKYFDTPPEVVLKRKPGGLGWYKRPSLFMPFAAARIFLEVTNVKCERLQDISGDDAIAEGIEMVEKYPEEAPGVMYYRDYLCKNRFAMGISFKAKQSFQTLWQSINGPGSWEANPWVFVYEFLRTNKP